MKEHYKENRQVELMKLNDLHPYKGNAKKHPAKQLDALCDMIKEFGFTSPILIDEENMILAGHGRHLAAKQLKLSEVPCVRISGLSEEQKKAYILADNRSSEIGGGWDIELLQVEIGSLQDAGFDLNLTGFDTFSVQELFADNANEQGGDEESDSGEGGGSYDDEEPVECPSCGHHFRL